MKGMFLETSSLLMVLSSILLVCLVGSVLAKKLRKSSLIFYILMGLLTSRVILNNEVAREFIEPLSSLGIVLLLFTIGLEMPLPRLLRSGKLLMMGSIFQVLVSSVLLFIPLYLWLQNASLAILLGLVFTMSSTAVVAKLLEQKGEDSSLTGEITMSILIFQDLVSVGLITLLTLMVNSGSLEQNLFTIFASKTILVVVIFFILTKLINLVFNKLKLNREELSLFTFALLFLVIGVFGFFAIPETTAGFLIGVLLAGKREQHEIFSQVRVFRDVLLVLFFFFLGTYLHGFQLGLVFWAFWLAALIMILKFVALWFIYVVLGLHRKTAFWVAFDLMQIGEFAFVMLTILAKSKLLSSGQSQLLIMVIIWSLLLFNLVYRSKLKYYRWLDYHLLRRWSLISPFTNTLVKSKFDQLELKDHIILCGYGRVGSYIGHGLILSGLPLVVIDTDVDRIKKLLDHKVRAIYGDATESEILDYAQVEKAKFLIVSVPSSTEQEQIILEAKKFNPKIQILTRTHLSQNLRHFKALGVWQVIQPEFEAAITLLKKILKLYGLDKAEIRKRLQYLKMEHGIQT